MNDLDEILHGIRRSETMALTHRLATYIFSVTIIILLCAILREVRA